MPNYFKFLCTVHFTLLLHCLWSQLHSTSCTTFGAWNICSYTCRSQKTTSNWNCSVGCYLHYIHEALTISPLCDHHVTIHKLMHILTHNTCIYMYPCAHAQRDLEGSVYKHIGLLLLCLVQLASLWGCFVFPFFALGTARPSALVPKMPVKNQYKSI